MDIKAELYADGTEERVWVFYSKDEKGAEAEWVRTLRPGSIHFWEKNSKEFIRELQRGDSVVMIVRDAVVALATLMSGREWDFRRETGDRQWPLLIQEVLPEPLDIDLFARGEPIVPYAGSVQRLFHQTLEALRSKLFERDMGRIFRARIELGVEDCAERIAEALEARPQITADEAFLAAVARARPADSRFPLLTDAPSETEDRLDRGPYALFLARRLNRIWHRLNPPEPAVARRNRPAGGDEGDTFILHVDAPWGGGKSTFANFLARILQPGTSAIRPGHFLHSSVGEQPEGPKLDLLLPLADSKAPRPQADQREWIIARYNAWRDQNVQPPWWQIFCAVETAIHRQLDGPGARLRRFRIWVAVLSYKLGNSKLRTQIRTAALFLGLIAIVGLVHWFSDDKSDTAVYSRYTAIAAAVGFGGTAIAALVTALGQSLNPDLDFTAESKQVGVSDPVSRFRKMFDRTLEVAARPVLLVVDDIDRCDPGTVVEVMRGFQTVVRSSRLFVLLLGDRNWIEAAHDLHHKEMANVADPESSLGAQFVRKVIQLSFRLPLMSEYARQDYTSYLLSDRPANGRLEPEVQDALDEVERSVATGTLREEPVAARERKIERAARKAKDLLEAAGRGDLTGRVDRMVGIRQIVAASEDPDREHEISEALRSLFSALPNNPRQMKRIVSAFSVYENVGRLYFQYRQTPIGEDGEEKARRWHQLALWVTLATEWPRTWRALGRRPELLTLAYGGPAERLRIEAEFDGLDESERAAILRLERRLRSDPQLVALLRHEKADLASEPLAICEFNRIIWEAGFRLHKHLDPATIAAEPAL